MTQLYKLIILSTILTSCLNHKTATTLQTINKTYDFKLDNVEIFDNARNRKIPVAFYFPKTGQEIKNQQIIIFSHGYGQNKGGNNLVYSYLTENLASKGYYVVSIQHELPTDELLPMKGNLQIVRRPNWERGVENILFVLKKMKEIKPNLDYRHLTLIGHSNGGDMTMLFANKYPELVNKVISMDNRRMPLPKLFKPKIYTLRSNDFPADEGVLPTSEEQIKYKITIQPTNINHSSMDNEATMEERKIINRYIEKYLTEK
ncbi:MAG: alpha/beta hydrolase [Terrimonas sp.]|nr:alpha/beta hydrolase [Terrimonas sp.]